MIKDIEKFNETVTINQKELSALKNYFPSCFKKNGAFDIELFKAILEDKVDFIHEGYELKFLGKSYAKLLTSIETTTVITPNLEHNSMPVNEKSENIYISGDNLDGLKHLLKSYSNSVKCIYVDPPYNTGKDEFVYNDKFSFTIEDLQHKLSIDEEQAQRILDLTNRGSASHSAWLLFMYPRLQLAKDLLKNDGVIFISIDDSQQANLKLICDEIFGEENYLGEIIWETATDNNASQISIEHEYIISYCRNINYQDKWKIKSDKAKVIQEKYEELLNKNLAIDEIQKQLKRWISSLKKSNQIDLSGVSHYSYVDEKGVYYPGNSNNTKPGDYNYDIIHPITKTPCKKPSNGWRWPETTFWKANEKGDVEWGKDETTIPKIKKRIETATELLKSYYYEDNRSTTISLTELFGTKVFDNPKSVKLISKFLKFTTSKDDLILDFFSGSATTAQATLELNSLDAGKRKIISVQLPETLNPKKASQKNAYNFLKSINRPTTLDYVGIERIIRASEKIKKETKAVIDYGFKHFVLNEPNQKTLDKCETFDKRALIADSTILDDFGLNTVLTTWLNYDGYGLNPSVEEIDLGGYKAYYFDKHLYLINPDFTQDNVISLFELYEENGSFNPENVILFGYSFNEWSVTEMLEKNLKILNDSEKNLKININVRY
ncbi:site-specific DNA-methyltransferase [Winogradskyella sediminis]|uniref:site-specific DNA-methyltransferase n=1 Tax=Winogradskyella sediminis TaxID=1382466 RepID=UPI000E23A7FD|nr:site-specific DNA-methyltransferase [Winogradskyella sediminis]REG84109.1 type III restriction enzyme/adenine-specific DNA-methyltransferase [Winogradskyella sediminis]